MHNDKISNGSKWPIAVFPGISPCNSHTWLDMGLKLLTCACPKNTIKVIKYFSYWVYWSNVARSQSSAMGQNDPYRTSSVNVLKTITINLIWNRWMWSGKISCRFTWFGNAILSIGWECVWVSMPAMLLNIFHSIFREQADLIYMTFPGTKYGQGIPHIQCGRRSWKLRGSCRKITRLWQTFTGVSCTHSWPNYLKTFRECTKKLAMLNISCHSP